MRFLLQNSSKKNNNLITQNKKRIKQKIKNNIGTNKIINNNMEGISSKRKSLLSLNNNKNKDNIINNKKIANKPMKKLKKTINKKINSNTKSLNHNQKKSNYEKILDLNDNEKNNLTYQEALKSDSRSCVLYYISLIRTNHSFFFTFVLNTDYNSKIIKIYIFFFIMSLNLTINALFFDDATMHLIYKEKGKFDLIYQIPKIIYSTIISVILSKIIKFLPLTEKNIISLKNENNNQKILIKKEKEVLSSINKKIIFFFLFSFFLLLFFCYYIACFCAVYKNTQLHLIKDFIISFCSSFIYPFFICLIPGIFRIIALKNKKECIYKFSKLIQ